MYKRSVIVATMAALLGIAAGAERPLAPPKVSLAVPPPFKTSVTVRHWRAGEDILNSPPYRLTTSAAMTEYHGWFGRRVPKQGLPHGWTVQVYATFSKKVAAACAAAKDGSAADLQEGPGLLEGESPSDMVARVRRKQFSWGRAVSFLSQSSTQDGPLSAPVSGHLRYEVWGITHDQRHTVVASVSVSHPELPDSDDTARLRVAQSTEAIKRHPGYKRIQTCRSEEFAPSLTAFDEMLDSLTIR